MNKAPVIPQSVRDLMASIGPVWAKNTKGHIRQMLDVFSEVLKDAPKSGIHVEHEIRYGAHERQVFDVFRPERQSTKRPGLIFVHGGAFTEGSRNRTAEIYSNVLYYFARNEVVGINSGYRLAPDACYPEATDDLEKIVKWTFENADTYGIDRNRIYLMGHSAGGAHVASYAYDKTRKLQTDERLAGLIIISGRVRADNDPRNPNAQRVAAYYGADRSIYDSISPVSFVDQESIPTFIATAEFENPLIDVYCCELAYKLALAKGAMPPFYWMKGHNHTSIIAHFNTAEDELGRAILNFMS